MAVEDTKRRPEWGLSEPRSFCSTKSQVWKTVQRQKTQAGMQCVEGMRDLKERGLKSVMREMWPELRLC